MKQWEQPKVFVVAHACQHLSQTRRPYCHIFPLLSLNTPRSQILIPYPFYSLQVPTIISFLFVFLVFIVSLPTTRMANHVSEYGFQAVPRDAAKILHGKENVVDPTPLAISRIEFPDTALVKAVHSYAKIELPSRTFNHSMRVYYYGERLLLPLSISTYHPLITFTRYRYQKAAVS